MNEGGLPYQLYFAAIIISDKGDRIWYVDPIHNDVSLISSPSSMYEKSTSKQTQLRDCIRDFQILNKNQVRLDIFDVLSSKGTSGNGIRLSSSTISPSTPIAFCNDLVLLTSSPPSYDVVGNYRACFVSLLTKYNLLQKFARKGLKPYDGLVDDPFKSGEKKLLCDPQLQRLWFHCYNPCVLSSEVGEIHLNHKSQVSNCTAYFV